MKDTAIKEEKITVPLVQVTIDGQKVMVEPGTTILDAAEKAAMTKLLRDENRLPETGRRESQQPGKQL